MILRKDLPLQGILTGLTNGSDRLEVSNQLMSPVDSGDTAFRLACRMLGVRIPAATYQSRKNRKLIILQLAIMSFTDFNLKF